MALTNPHQYSADETAAIYKVIAERRDIRHFVPGPVDPALLQRLLNAAHLGPSVGFMQPWRFIRITDPALRVTLHQIVEEERIATAHALGQREDEFMRLKVEGMRECGELLAVALMERREQHVFGRRTLPEMDLASVACAIQNMWLAARAEGIGMGWISMFDPARVCAVLDMPEGAKPVALLCLGQVASFYPQPMLEMEGWAKRESVQSVLFENTWGQQASSDE